MQAFETKESTYIWLRESISNVPDVFKLPLDFPKIRGENEANVVNKRSAQSLDLNTSSEEEHGKEGKKKNEALL